MRLFARQERDSRPDKVNRCAGLAQFLTVTFRCVLLKCVRVFGGFFYFFFNPAGGHTQPGNKQTR